MDNNTITSDGETRSLPVPVEHKVMLPVPVDPPAKVRTVKVCSEFSGLVIRPYRSMPNIAVMCGAANGQSKKENDEFSGLTKRKYYSMPKIAVMFAADDADQLKSPPSVSTLPVPEERVVASSGDLTGPPNICVTFTAIEVGCISARASAEDLSGFKIPADGQTEMDSVTSCEAENEFKATSTQRVRRTWWKRTKKFMRRLFCCVPLKD